MHSAFDWLLAIVGIIAGLYSCSGPIYLAPEKPSLTVPQVLSLLQSLAESDEASLKRVPLTEYLLAVGVEGDDDPNVYILQNDNVLLVYGLEQEEQVRREQLAIKLSETPGAMAVFFEGSTLQKVLVNDVEVEEGAIPHFLRADLGKVLQLTRTVVRKYA